MVAAVVVLLAMMAVDGLDDLEGMGRRCVLDGIQN